jgi:hypothetical protein
MGASGRKGAAAAERIGKRKEEGGRKFFRRNFYRRLGM